MVLSPPHKIYFFSLIMNIRKTVLLLLLLSSTCFAQQVIKRPFFIGHSLVNEVMPKMVFDLAVDAGIYPASTDMLTRFGGQIILGAPLWYNWQHSNNGTFYGQISDARVIIPQGNHNVLVITEGIPIDASFRQYAGEFLNLAQTSNNQSQSYYYETWHWLNQPTDSTDINAVTYFNANYDSWFGLGGQFNLNIPLNNSYDFIDIIQRFRPFFNHIVNQINQDYPQHPKMLIIPVGTAMANLNQQITTGNVPGISNIDALFEADGIHPNDLGNYFIALVQFATIFKQSPQGLTYTTHN